MDGGEGSHDHVYESGKVRTHKSIEDDYNLPYIFPIYVPEASKTLLFKSSSF